MIPSELFSVEGRVAVVTGASSGLGRRFVEVLATNGAHVVAFARRADRLEALAARFDNVSVAAGDVTDEAHCARVMSGVVDRFGHLDILVNGAGISDPKRIEEELPADFRRVVDVNLHGVYNMTHAATKGLAASGRASVVNVASIVGIVGLGHMPQASYSASKGAVVALTRELAAQWARRSIRVNAIAPAFFESEMTEALFASERGAAWVDRMTPMGRRGADHEFDGALLYLASDASSYVTGTILCVDGGWTAV